MNPSTILLTLLYGGALAFVIYFIVQRSRPTIIQQVPTVYPEVVWWPWSAGSYNDWPYWAGWWSGGGDGGYGYYRGGRGYYRGGYGGHGGHSGGGHGGGGGGGHGGGGGGGHGGGGHGR